MVKIDIGLRDADADKKTQKKARRSDKKGFKSDRFDAYQQKFHPQEWKKLQHEKFKKGEKPGARPKEIKFDDSSRREFLTTLHKKKNERRVQAFVSGKRKQAKENAKFRQELKENARKMYNTMASVPILPNYKYKLPTLEDTLADALDDDVEEDEEAFEVDEEEKYDRDERKRLNRLAKDIDAKQNQTVFFSAKNTAASEEAANGKKGKKAAAATAAVSSVLEESGIVVSVEPLFGRRNATPAVEEETGGKNKPYVSRKQMSMKGSENLVNNIARNSALPLDVIKELAKIREETKGPSRTEPKLRMMKELEKIRKIKKHSRKGHGKKGGSSKKKNK